MNNLVIPPSPNWYETSILACAPDNTLIYGSRNDVVIIHDSESDQPADVKIIHRAHSQKVVSTSINKNWGQSNKLLVTAAEDNIIKLWDIEICKRKLANSSHIGHGKIVGATFAGDDRVVSVSEEGVIIVWNIILNSTNTIKDLFGLKVTITCISTCPHANWLAAFGLKNGLVVVADLRKQGKVLHKLRGHDKSVLSFSWCPAPVNIFPRDPNNYVGEKEAKQVNVGKTTETVQIPMESDSVVKSCESVKPVVREFKKRNIWIGLKHEDDSNSEEESNEKETVPDFLQECMALRATILDGDKSKNFSEPEVRSDNKEERVIIKANRARNTHGKVVNEVKNDENIVEAGKSVADDKKINEIIADVGGVVENVNKCDNFESVVHDSENLKVSDEKEATNGSKSAVSEVNKVASVDDALESVIGRFQTVSIDSSVEKGEKTCAEATRDIPLDQPEKEDPRKEFLLASSGKDGNIYIWRAGTDGRMQTFLTLPNKSGNRRSNKHPNEKLWTVLCWISPTTLLSSSKSVELVKWTLPKPKDVKKQLSIVHNDHNSMLFSMAAPLVVSNEGNFLRERELNVWTTGHDRLLLNTTVSKERKNLACYPTIGNAECFALSPLDPNRLAVGTAEGVIKTWDLSRPHTKNIAMSNFYQKIQSKVVALAWHPTNELTLAYGTVEGRVGFMDVSNRSKAPTLMPNFFKTQIHGVMWGPVDGSFKLFVVAEGKLVVFSEKQTEKAPIEVDTPDNTFVYTAAWKPDFSTLLVGTRTGSIIVYSPRLEILSTHYLPHRLKGIYWHPDASLSETENSEHRYRYRFAAISNSKDVIVCDFSNDSKEVGDGIVVKYEGVDDVNCIAWNPFDSEELVFAGEDGIAQLWNVNSNTFTSTYTSPNYEGILCTIWSPLDPNYIISGVKDHTIRIWKVSDYPRRDLKEIREARRETLKQITKEQDDLLPKVNKQQEEPVKNRKPTKANILPKFYTPKDSTQILDDLRRLFLWKEGRSDGTDPSEILKILGSKSDMLRMVEENETYLQERGKYGSCSTLSLFKGDVGSQIRKAIDERRVTPWVVMMAPMVSPKLWQSACETYAVQLSETTDSDPIETATFYLACHKVDEAIDVLCQGALFREALALAKCRMPEDSPVVTDILNRWVKYSVSVGNFETAAQCCIFLDRYDEAASVLFRRSDVKTLKFAMELAEKSGNEDLYKAVSFRYNAFEQKNTKPEEQEITLPTKLDAVLRSKDGITEETSAEASSGSEETVTKAQNHEVEVETFVVNVDRSGKSGENCEERGSLPGNKADFDQDLNVE